MTHILVVEDDESIRRGLNDLLESENYQVSLAKDGHEGLKLSLTTDADLVLLDIMLPGPDGYEILKAMRKDNLMTPVIFLSAKSQELDKVLGFRLGADDYVVKPFGSQELLMRIKVRLQRPQDTVLRKYSCGEIELDLVSSRLMVTGQEVQATAKEKELLAYLMRHPGAALSRQQILDDVWGYGSSQTTRTVDSHIFSLRQKIEADSKKPKHITSVHNVGYRFENSI